MRQDLIDLPGKEIKKLKDSGEDITYVVSIPLFCYIGDTTETVFKNENIFNYPTIITECTFIYPEHMEEADENKH